MFFAVLIGAFALGQGAPNLQNLLQAAGAAGTIYDIIDRVKTDQYGPLSHMELTSPPPELTIGAGEGVTG